MILAALAMLQAMFLPGFTALRLSGRKSGSYIETAVVTLALSLLINYLFVLATTMAGIYGRTAVLSFIVVELLLLAAVLIRSPAARAVDFRFQVLRPQTAAGRLLVGLSALGTLVSGAIALLPGPTMAMFVVPDAAFTWNEWAYAWYGGSVPQGTMMYPQLIPANWSMMYHVVGSPELQMLPLALMPWFGVGILAMFFDLGTRRARLEYHLALLLCLASLVPLRHYLMPYGNMFGGFMDVPVAFMAMVALYLLEARDDRHPSSWRELALPAVFASTAAVTKFNGAVALALVGVIAFLGHMSVHRTRTTEWLKSITAYAVIAGTVAGSWWMLKLADFYRGVDSQNSAELSRAVEATGGGTDLSSRLLNAVAVFPGRWFALVAIGVVVLLALRVPRTRWVTLGILIPYTLLWALFLSYDVRNWMIMVPLLAYVAAFGVMDLVSGLTGWHDAPEAQELVVAMPTRTAWVTFAAVGSTLLLASALISTDAMNVRALEAQRRIGNASLNHALYEAFPRPEELKGTFVTDYSYLKLLPGFRDNSLRLDHNGALQVRVLMPYNVMPDDLDGADHLLLSDQVSDDVAAALTEGIDSGKLTVVFEHRFAGFFHFAGPVRMRLIAANH